MATSVTSNHRIYLSNDWNQDEGVFRFLFSVPASNFLFFVFLSSFRGILSFSSVSWCGLLWHQTQGAVRGWRFALMEGDDWSPTWVWHVLSLQSLLKQPNCFQLILTWCLVTKIREKEGVFCRSDTKVSRAMTWLAAGTDTPSTSEKPLAETRPAMHCLFWDPQTQWVTQRRKWIMQQSIFIH